MEISRETHACLKLNVDRAGGIKYITSLEG